MKKVFKFLFRTLLILFVLLNIITAFHAYKFTHFYDVGQVAYKQDADKTSWDKTKEILFGINAIKGKNKVPADTMFEKVYLTTKDRLKLEGWYFKSAIAPKGTVVMFHGHGNKKSSVMTEAEGFRQLGYNTFLLDFRAHGSSEGNTTSIGFYETEEVKLAYDFVKDKGEKNIVLWGISMGAAAISKAMYDYPLQPAKVILEMPYASILEAAEGRIKMMGLPAEPLAALVIFWGGIEHGYWAFNMKPVNFVKKITQPTLLQWGRLDPRVQQAETDAIFNNIAATKKDLVIYESSGHESLCEKENAKWMKSVDQFLNQ